MLEIHAKAKGPDTQLDIRSFDPSERDWQRLLLFSPPGATCLSVGFIYFRSRSLNPRKWNLRFLKLQVYLRQTSALVTWEGLNLK